MKPGLQFCLLLQTVTSVRTMRQIIVLSVIIAVSLTAPVKTGLKLIQVQVLFRHGDRTPTLEDMYPNDIYNMSVYQPWGLGQLINIGKMREYEIGQLLKTRYRRLLGPLYIPEVVYAVSTDCDRTKMSLALVLAGLFPPSEAQTWNPKLPWMPIPIHFAPEPLDILMKSHLCPQFEEAETEVIELPEVRAKIGAYNDLFDFLTVKTGLNVTEPEVVYRVFNTLVAQQAMNLTRPEWCTDDIYRQISEVAILQYELWSYSMDTRRLGGGPLVRKFIENMFLDRKEDNPRKLYLYSTHERTVAAYLRAHRITVPEIPAYGTTVMVEKLEDIDGKLYVKIVLWTGVTEKLMILRIPGCQEVCPIERYLQLTRDLIPSDDELDCHWKRLSFDELRRVFDERISD